MAGSPAAPASGKTLGDDDDLSARYASVRRFVLKLRAAADAGVVITTAPGGEGQVDYGEEPIVRTWPPGDIAGPAYSSWVNMPMYPPTPVPVSRHRAGAASCYFSVKKSATSRCR
jgi:hypothetical protein